MITKTTNKLTFIKVYTLKKLFLKISKIVGRISSVICFCLSSPPGTHSSSNNIISTLCLITFFHLQNEPAMND